MYQRQKGTKSRGAFRLRAWARSAEGRPKPPSGPVSPTGSLWPPFCPRTRAIRRTRWTRNIFAAPARRRSSCLCSISSADLRRFRTELTLDPPPPGGSSPPGRCRLAAADHDKSVYHAAKKKYSLFSPAPPAAVCPPLWTQRSESKPPPERFPDGGTSSFPQKTCEIFKIPASASH